MENPQGWHMEFTAVLEQDPDGGWVVEIPGIPGCYSQGDTRDEALANIREVLRLLREEQELPSPVHIELARLAVDA